eukprot:1196575-Rhodomonas_salina.1
MDWELDDWDDIDMSFEQKLIHYRSRQACGLENMFQPSADPLGLAHDVFDAAGAGATNHDELEQVYIDGIILSSYCLNPDLLWKKYGLLGGDTEETELDIPSPLLLEMD